MARHLRCRLCGTTYPLEPRYVCEECLGPLDAVSVVEGGPAGSGSGEAEALRRTISAGPPTLWRYAPFLPVDPDPASDLGAGWTPLLPAPRLGAALGLRRLYLKNDAANPTWSFKDRVVAVGIAAARQFGFTVAACASTGNLANAVAACAARAGLRAVVFVPRGLEAEKLVLSAVYGATIVEVDGTYDDVNRLCTQVADEYRWAFLNVNLRPYYADGAKTLGYEVAEQLGWRLPDHVVVPMASGNLLVKIARAFAELAEVGLAAARPVQVHGAQPAGCAPIAAAFAAGAAQVAPVRPQTAVRSLAIGSPADGLFALRAIRDSGGRAVAVTDEEAADAVALLARTEGLFTESAGGVTVAALRRLAQAGAVDPEATVVVYLTGMGLKTRENLVPLPGPVAIRPTLAAFEAAVLPRLEGVAAAAAGAGAAAAGGEG
ncbi:MAG: threonine synthase [Armatimonadota bacterium]|nr:threonine synthase [Armatimonadota bacterium]MDR7450021.1 threonine synthase [Armatimonadota bacterium]MDR7460181.1 threonine synthase [Armatimonadota bacterium]MDR7480735.1 threonine synthase [Armatimonadota bacterium]MDR7488919.1 threonine synthase [Armatimonadota bacterium]